MPKRSRNTPYINLCLYVYMSVGNARERILVRISREDGRTDYGETFVSDLYMREKIGYLELAYAFLK